MLLFLAVFALGIMREAAGTNSYAMLAQNWLDGRFDTTTCFDDDCAVYEDRQYIIFPPAPAAVALPFVAAFGADFVGFLPLALIALAISARSSGGGLRSARPAPRSHHSRRADDRIRHTAGVRDPAIGSRLVLGPKLGLPVRAQPRIYFALVRRNALLTGLFIGLAFLSRQMTILLLPFLYILMLDRDAPLFRDRSDRY